MMQVPKPKKYDKVEDRENSRLAAKLDCGLCQWCLFQKGIVVSGSIPHHIWGRRKRWDIDAQITLCIECHTAVHTARQRDGETEITREKLVQLMEEKVIPARKLAARRLELAT